MSGLLDSAQRRGMPNIHQEQTFRFGTNTKEMFVIQNVSQSPIYLQDVRDLKF